MITTFGSFQVLGNWVQWHFYNNSTQMGPTSLSCLHRVKSLVFRFYTKKFHDLNFTSWSYILFTSVAPLPSIFSIKYHISLSRMFDVSNKMIHIICDNEGSKSWGNIHFGPFFMIILGLSYIIMFSHWSYYHQSILIYIKQRPHVGMHEVLPCGALNFHLLF